MLELRSPRHRHVLQYGLIALKVMLDAAHVTDEVLVEHTQAFLWNSYAQDSTFVIDAPVWESDGRLRLDFSSKSFVWAAMTTIKVHGTAYVERRGPFLVIFCTFLPAYEVEFLTPHLAHIRNSIEVYREVLWY